MRLHFFRRIARVMVCLAVSYAAHAQAPDTSIEAALQSLHMRAAVAFRGEVLAVQRVGGVVEVQFRVDEWLKGGAGSAYLLREWAGLWAAGERRYRVGQRVVLFLHAAGASGMASPVDGLDGVLPMAGADAGAAIAPVQAVSVERLRTRVLRSVGTRLAASPGPMSLAALRAAMLPAPRPPVWMPLPLPPPAPGPVGLPGRSQGFEPGSERGSEPELALKTNAAAKRAVVDAR